MIDRRPQGFTLLEVMVALAIFALSATVLLHQSGRSSLQMSRLEDRAIAGWVAENQLNRLRLQALPASNTSTVHEQTMARRQWRITTEISDTSRRDFKRVDISVALRNLPGHPVITLQSYLGEH